MRLANQRYPTQQYSRIFHTFHSALAMLRVLFTLFAVYHSTLFPSFALAGLSDLANCDPSKKDRGKCYFLVVACSESPPFDAWTHQPNS